MACAPIDPAAFLPTTAAELKARGWDAVDVLLVSGDAYIDHPSFAAALLSASQSRAQSNLRPSSWR